MVYTLVSKRTLPKSELELTLDIDADAIASEREHALDEAAKDAELDGFRKGHVPKEVIRKRMGELALWEDAALRALSRALAEISRDEKLDVIGRPAVSVTKLAPDNPAGFKVVVSLFPKLALPDYKALAGKHNARPAESAAVEEKEIDAVIAEIVKEHGRRTGEKEFAVSDETVKKLGEFSSAADFRAKVTEGLAAHKKARAVEKRRAELLGSLTEGANGELPDVLIEHELERLEAEFKAELLQFGASFEQYLKEIKKDLETVRKEWRPDAEKRARLHLALAEIARIENIAAPAEEVEKQVKHILEQYKNAKEENARLFVENALLNQKVIEWLEWQP